MHAPFWIVIATYVGLNIAWWIFKAVISLYGTLHIERSKLYRDSLVGVYIDKTAYPADYTKPLLYTSMRIVKVGLWPYRITYVSNPKTVDLAATPENE